MPCRLPWLKRLFFSYFFKILVFNLKTLNVIFWVNYAWNHKVLVLYRKLFSWGFKKCPNSCILIRVMPIFPKRRFFGTTCISWFYFITCITFNNSWIRFQVSGKLLQWNISTKWIILIPARAKYCAELVTSASHPSTVAVWRGIGIWELGHLYIFRNRVLIIWAFKNLKIFHLWISKPVTKEDKCRYAFYFYLYFISFLLEVKFIPDKNC